MDFFTNLTHLMMTVYILFDQQKNPVLRHVTQRVSQCHYVLTQYFFLVRSIVEMLTIMQDRARELGWTKVVANLGVNIGQEKGSETDGVSHAEILCQGLRTVFGLDVGPVTGTLPNMGEETRRFLTTVYGNLRGPNPSLALGTAYALESSAVPELRIVYALVDRLCGMTGKQVTESLQDFFSLHLELWEPGHEVGLRLASAKYLTSDADREAFRTGFVSTIEAMEKWWAGMAMESLRVPE